MFLLLSMMLETSEEAAQRTERDPDAVADCICQVQQDLIDQGCDKPREVCFSFGSGAQYYLDSVCP